LLVTNKYIYAMPDSASNSESSDMPRTQAERTALAESRMIKAAIKLLNTVGLQGTTAAAVGLNAGYSRGLAAHHFGTKAGLYRAVLKHVSTIWSDELNSSLGDKTGLDAVATAIDTHLAHALSHPEFIRAQNILWGAALDPSSEFKPNVAEFMQIQRDAVSSWIREGKSKGEIDQKINARRVAEQFYGGLIGINSQWLVSPDFDLAAAYKDFKRNMLRQLRA
jgi:AcrR family transcriptional regulator